MIRSFIAGNNNIYEQFINDVEKILIQEALKSMKNRRIDAAKALGIGRNTITRKIKELKINIELILETIIKYVKDLDFCNKLLFFKFNIFMIKILYLDK